MLTFCSTCTHKLYCTTEEKKSRANIFRIMQLRRSCSLAHNCTQLHTIAHILHTTLPTISFVLAHILYATLQTVSLVPAHRLHAMLPTFLPVRAHILYTTLPFSWYLRTYTAHTFCGHFAMLRKLSLVLAHINLYICVLCYATKKIFLYGAWDTFWIAVVDLISFKTQERNSKVSLLSGSPKDQRRGPACFQSLLQSWFVAVGSKSGCK